MLAQDASSGVARECVLIVHGYAGRQQMRTDGECRICAIVRSVEVPCRYGKARGL